MDTFFSPGCVAGVFLVLTAPFCWLVSYSSYLSPTSGKIPLNWLCHIIGIYTCDILGPGMPAKRSLKYLFKDA